MIFSTTKPKNFSSLSFDDAVKCSIKCCDERLAALNRLPSISTKLDNHNIYIPTIRAIRDYLDAYLSKDSNNNFDTIAKAGYEKFNKFSTSDYIPPLTLYLTDTLNINDLGCIFELLDQSAFQSNSEYLQQAFKITNKKAMIQRDLDATDSETIRHFKNDLMSNGFKYFIQGVLSEQSQRWSDLFGNDSGRHNTPENVEFAFNMLNLPILATGATGVYEGAISAGMVFLLAAGSFYKISGKLSDVVSITLFGKSEQNKSHEDQRRPEKQHITPYHV